MQSLPRPDTTDPSSRQPLVAQKENPSQLCVNISCGKSQTILVADVKLKNKKSERVETFSFFFVKPFSFYLVQLQLPRRVNAWGESLSFTSHLRRAKTLNLARTRSQSSLEKQASSEEGGSLPGFVGGERDCVCISSTQFVLPLCRDKSTLPWQPWAHGHSSAGLLRRGISREMDMWGILRGKDVVGFYEQLRCPHWAKPPAMLHTSRVTVNHSVRADSSWLFSRLYLTSKISMCCKLLRALQW